MAIRPQVYAPENRDCTFGDTQLAKRLSILPERTGNQHPINLRSAVVLSETKLERRRYRDSVSRLQATQRPSAGTAAYSRFVNRPLGRRLAAAAYVLGWTPNTVTFVSAASTFIGIALVALVPPAWWLGPIVSLLLIFGYAMDSADGQLARLRAGGSAQGEWLDHIVDAAKLVALHSAVLIVAYRFFDIPRVYLLIPLGFLFVDVVGLFEMILKELLARSWGR